LKIGVLKEITVNETRVALIPVDAGRLKKAKYDVFIETGAGDGSFFSDSDFQKAGAVVKKSAPDVIKNSNIILKVQPPEFNKKLKKHEFDLLKTEIMYIGFLPVFSRKDIIKQFNQKKITSFSMEFVPRITRAQSMDALSSMATLAGYKAVLLAVDRLPKILPLLMTAAGTIPPATVLVLGAGVAGLQAIATARRLGAKVEAFDPRPAVKEQVMSLGAKFIEMPVSEDVETAGGYAKMQSAEFLRQEQEVIASRLPKTDVVITTAQIFGKKSPLLITKKMVDLLKPGSIIVDLAAEQGGNCEYTVFGKQISKHGVTIIGPDNLPATLPVHASQMYSKNISNLFLHLFSAEDSRLDFKDEITAGCCITHAGKLVNPYLVKLAKKE
jgi:NAD(P) transhydrogenase subunit alpha